MIRIIKMIILATDSNIPKTEGATTTNTISIIAIKINAPSILIYLYIKIYMQKIDWVLLGGLALGGIVGVFLLHSVIPVTARTAVPESKQLINKNMVPVEIPFDSPEGWNWDLNMEKIAKDYEIETTQSPYWSKIGNEYYNPHNVY